MPFKKGETGSKKGRSGRKSLAKEIEAVKEKITQDALIELANKKVFVAINSADNHDDIKEIALPVALKGMTDKKTLDVNLPEPILNVFSNNSDKKNNKLDQEDKNNPGGNERIQNSLNRPILDTSGAE